MNKKKLIIISISIFVVVMIIGVSYAMYGKSISGTKDTKVIAGDIYMRYINGETKEISMTPSDTYNEGDYYEFTISGKNTSNKDIIYDIVLNHGEELASPKIRLDDKYLRFRLVTVDNNVETLVDTADQYPDITNKKLYVGTIPNTNNYNVTYRLYVWVNGVIVGNVPNANYSETDWPNVYANLKVDVNGNFVEREADGPLTSVKLIQNIKTNNLKTSEGTPLNYVTETNNFGTETEQTITYLSGCSKYYLDQGAAGCTQDNTIDFNYVWYSGRMWRITSFNETTNTIKLITEQPQTVIAWNDSNGIFESSYVKIFLNDEFYDTLYQPTNFIDTSVLWDVSSTDSVSTKLSNPTVTSNVGLLNTYEYYKSYEKITDTYKKFGYLNIGQRFWLLNSYRSSYVWYVNYDGNAYNNGPTSTYAVRPSINLLSTVNFTGHGTESDPYRLVGDMSTGNINDDLNTRQVGEYVKLKSGANEQVFRIVSFENNTTKLISVDYADNGITKNFATTNISGLGTIFGNKFTIDDTSNTTWYSYLKNIYISDLKTKYGSNMFTTGEYYLGQDANNPTSNTTYYNYRTSICAYGSDFSKNCTKSQSITLEAGLLRYGEMLAAQHGIGYNTKTSNYNTKAMLLMTRKNQTYVWGVGSSGSAGSYTPTNEYAGRPSINLSSEVKIVTCDAEVCDGTPSHPYVVGM